MIIRAAILPGIISLVYVGIATLILYKGIIHTKADSIYYTLSRSEYNFFEPGYFLGYLLAYAGGPFFVAVGQLLTLGVTFVIVDLVIGIGEFFYRKLV